MEVLAMINNLTWMLWDYLSLAIVVIRIIICDAEIHGNLKMLFLEIFLLDVLCFLKGTEKQRILLTNKLGFLCLYTDLDAQI